MATSSPSKGNNSSPSPTTTASAMSTGKTLRGFNKPKCVKCGNVARSRCPFQSCKNCCAKAENPCHIHVLKANATFPDKSPNASSSVSEKQPTEASQSGASHRIASLRQLSNSFAQFNNLQSPLRSRRPVTRKEAAVINEWRFKKLNEYKEGLTQQENEAFDRYMRNVSLLEDVLAVDDAKPEERDMSPNSENKSTSSEDGSEMMLSALKLKQRSNPIRSENLRKRMQAIVAQGLEKLRKIEVSHGENDPKGQSDGMMKDARAERQSSMNDLLEKLGKARNEDDLKSCLEMKNQLFGWERGKSPMQTEGAGMSSTEISENDAQLRPDYEPPKWFTTGSVDQEALNRIDSLFSTSEIEQL